MTSKIRASELAPSDVAAILWSSAQQDMHDSRDYADAKDARETRVKCRHEMLDAIDLRAGRMTRAEMVETFRKGDLILSVAYKTSDPQDWIDQLLSHGRDALARGEEDCRAIVRECEEVAESSRFFFYTQEGGE